jgi:hypothetical protein
MPLAAALSRRRLGRAGLLVTAALAPFIAFPVQASADYTACIGQALQPSYDSSSKSAEGAGYLPCDGSFTVSLRSTSGTVLSSFSGLAPGGSVVYTDFVHCASGTVVYSFLSSHGSAGGIKWAGTSRSASITCT